MKQKHAMGLLIAALISATTFSAQAANYVMDTKKAHAFIQFKISHLGYSWLLGRFNTFTGQFSYDEKNPSASKVMVEIDTSSVDSNHAERDKHLRSDDFLHVDKFPKASFVSTGFRVMGGGMAQLMGNLTMKGVTRPLAITVRNIGQGNDPWGGYRSGFEGETSFKLTDFGIMKNLGPASQTVHLYLSIEGIRKK